MAIAEKDYYAVLQVHSSAERIVIEAAYKRLAREYHPDVYKGSDAHLRMVAINEAWEILGDAASREAYDRARRTQQSAPRVEPTTTRAHRESAAPKYHATPPAAPSPRDFGIDPGYLDKAIEGCRAWKARRKILPTWAQAMIFITVAGAGVATSIFATAPELSAVSAFSGYGWIAGIVLGYLLSFGMQQLHDRHLLASEYNPKYNPHPERYAKFADAYADYETEMSDVHLTRTGSCYHSRNFCSGNLGTFDLPLYEAKARGYRPCSHCGYTKIRAKLLPPPFGFGRDPDLPERAGL